MAKCAQSNGSEVMLFSDPMHQIHNSSSGYAWQIKGNKNTYNVLTNSGRRRLNILGAINPITLIPTVLLTEANCDSEMTEVFFEEIRNEYPDTEIIHIFLDNASYHRAYAARDKAEELGMKLHYLPPYSPNLNLIERLWKFFKKKVIRNRYYPTFDRFFEAHCDFFRNFEDYIPELESLLTLNFQII